MWRAGLAVLTLLLRLVAATHYPPGFKPGPDGFGVCPGNQADRGRNGYCGIDYEAKAAYFNFENAALDSVYVFALNVAANGDIYFHMSGPRTHCWIGVGFGDSMTNSFMLISYPSADGLTTITSPRISTGHTEPVYDPTVEVIGVFNDTYAPNANTVTENGTATIISHAMCRNCSRWMTPDGPRSLDTSNKEQPFIFALGPNITFRSDSLEASLPRHSFVGRFTMNLNHATNKTGWYGRVPAPNVPHFPFPPNDTAFASFASTPAFDTMLMDNPLPGIHAALMMVAFVLLFPFGAMIMQFLRKVLWHAAIQVLGFIFVFSGFGVAVRFSPQYNKSKNYDSYHQVIGFIILAGLAIQLGLGLLHHSVYGRRSEPSPFGQIHFFLGPAIIVLGIINGGLGLKFAGSRSIYWIVPYSVVAGLIGAMFMTLYIGYVILRRRKKYQPEPEMEKEEHFAKDGDSEYELRNSPGYGEQPPEPYSPTTPFSGTFESMVPAPYSPTTPYSPVSAYLPMTASTWRKEDVSNWPPYSYSEYEHGKF